MNAEKDRYFTMRAKHDGFCAECHDPIKRDEVIVWDSYEYKAYHKECAEELA